MVREAEFVLPSAVRDYYGRFVEGYRKNPDGNGEADRRRQSSSSWESRITSGSKRPSTGPRRTRARGLNQSADTSRGILGVARLKEEPWQSRIGGQDARAR